MSPHTTSRPASRRIAKPAAPGYLHFGRGRGDSGLRWYDKFAGYGGSTEGASTVPGIVGVLASNHNRNAVEVHSLNHPHMDHFHGDLQTYDICKFGPCDIMWASPACPYWTDSQGVIHYFDTANQMAIPGMEPPVDIEAERSRLLMEEVPRYLEAMWMLGQPVLAGCIENVVEASRWHRFREYLAWFPTYHYDVWVVAFNSMHAEPVRTLKCPQTRDRMYILFALKAFGRAPDFDKWLRPTAWCPRCEEFVKARQSFKDPEKIMGRYGAQYVYRCPRTACRGEVIEPAVLPAAEAIDWSLASQRIGDRARPLAPKTLARIATGVLRYCDPVLVPSGGTWRNAPTPVSQPAPTRTTRESDGLAMPPLIAPYYSHGRPYPVSEPFRTVSTRDRSGVLEPPAAPGTGARGQEAQETGLPTSGAAGCVVAPFVATLRGGGSAKTPHPMTEPFTTVTGGGHHHLLAQADHAIARRPVQVDLDALPPLIAEIERVEAQILTYPKGPQRAAAKARLKPIAVRAGERLVQAGLAALHYRMLAVPETGRTMSFRADFQVTGSNSEIVRGYGNAVTPPVSECIVSALVEVVTGEELERAL